MKYNMSFMSPRLYKVFAKLEWLKDDKVSGSDRLFCGILGEIKKKQPTVADIFNNSTSMMK